MAFVAEPQRNTGDLISDSTWNQALVDNPNFLKGLAGPVDIEDDIDPTSDTFGAPFAAPAGSNLGIGGDPATAKRWQDVFGVRLFGNRYQADLQRRTVVLKWQSLDIGAADAFVDHHMIKVINGIADAVEGGLDQIVLGVDRVASADIQLNQRLSTLPPGSFAGLDNRWGGTRLPYFRIEFGFTPTTSNSEGIFFGIRGTPGTAIPIVTEEHMGLQFALGTWSAIMGSTTNKDLITFTSSVAVSTRQVFEIAVLSPTVADFYINGTFGGSFAANSIPSGLMQLSLLVSNVIADAGRIDFTIGETVLQEDRI